jgi:hypothetical protein
VVVDASPVVVSTVAAGTGKLGVSSSPTLPTTRNVPSGITNTVRVASRWTFPIVTVALTNDSPRTCWPVAMPVEETFRTALFPLNQLTEEVAFTVPSVTRAFATSCTD